MLAFRPTVFLSFIYALSMHLPASAQDADIRQTAGAMGELRHDAAKTARDRDHQYAIHDNWVYTRSRDRSDPIAPDAVTGPVYRPGDSRHTLKTNTAGMNLPPVFHGNIAAGGAVPRAGLGLQSLGGTPGIGMSPAGPLVNIGPGGWNIGGDFGYGTVNLGGDFDGNFGGNLSGGSGPFGGSVGGNTIDGGGYIEGGGPGITAGSGF